MRAERLDGEGESTGRDDELTNAGKSLEIYKRQSDGSWKLAVEMFNADEPAQG